MALRPQLQQKQSQSLVMTPKLAQSIKLLQYGHAELLEFLQEEVMKNPLLELDTQDGAQERGESASPEKPEKQSADTSGDLGDVVTTEMTLATGDHVNDMDASLENVYDSGTAGAEKQDDHKNAGSSASGETGPRHNSEDDFDFISQIGAGQSLAQNLEFQIATLCKEPVLRQVAIYLAHNLDEDGYFRDNLKDVAEQLGIQIELVFDALAIVQSLEPAGIGARNLAECLTLQLKDRDRFDPAMQVFVENLHLLAKREFETLKKLCGVSTEDFNDMIREIKSLDPKPAHAHEPMVSETVVPDVLITQKSDGSWAIDLNPETLPRVLVNKDYHAELSKSVHSEDGKEFITECLSDANWLTRSLDQRAQTILKVALEIVKQQDMFFANGVGHLKPMNLKTVADAIKMHESTVSRVTSNKYLMCDQGTFELKYFFSSAISSCESDEAHSAESVKHQIRQLVDAENPTKILSDDKLVNLLQETGIEIARRTVAKYREAMRIPSSVQRRREKQMFLKKSG